LVGAGGAGHDVESRGAVSLMMRAWPVAAQGVGFVAGVRCLGAGVAC
jgi:hypothetical protein